MTTRIGCITPKPGEWRCGYRHASGIGGGCASGPTAAYALESAVEEAMRGSGERSEG